MQKIAMVSDRYTGFTAGTMRFSRPEVFSQSSIQSNMARITFTLEDGTELEAELDTDVVTVGRHSDNHIVLPSASVSGHHATLTRQGDGFFIKDLGATNGTKLNGVEVAEAKLEGGDRLAFGDIPAVFHLGDPPASVIAIEPPHPTALAQPAPKPGVRAPGARPVARRPGVRRSYSATASQSSGCAGFFAILVFLSIAFVIGLFARHYVAYDGRFLLTDVAQIVRDKYFGGEAKSPAKDGKKESGGETRP
jgi:hypothetical protein